MSQRVASSPEQRLQEVRGLIADRGAVRIDELAATFGVSEMTIRRDLDELETLGFARRVRGGALALGSEPFEQRHRHNARAKAKIAEKLAPLVPNTGTIAFDASSTIHRLAGQLEGARDLTIVTNGIDTFQSLSSKPGITTTLTGGTREPRTDSLVGPVATRSVESFLFDTFFCSGAALDTEVGSSETSLAEAEVKRAIGRMSRRVVLAADRSKLTTQAQALVFALTDIALLVTDLHPQDPPLAPFRAAGVEVI